MNRKPLSLGRVSGRAGGGARRARAGRFGIVAPQPAERIGQDRSALLAVVPAIAVDKVVVVMSKLERGGHFLIRQRPIAELVVDVSRAVLQEHANWLRRRL